LIIMRKEHEEKKEINADAERIRPILEKDPDWPLASGQISWMEKEIYYRQGNAASRLTRKAVRELYPEHSVHVRRGRGTAYGWVNVNYIIPDIEGCDWLNVIRRTRNMLLSVGLQYDSFLGDDGPGNNWSPCLSVTVNHYC
jgi:hypothetical protein